MYKYKAVFLPLDDRILDLYKGYVMDGKELDELNEADLYTAEQYYEEQNDFSVTEKLVRIIFLGPLVPLLLIILLIAHIFKKFDVVAKIITSRINRFFNYLFLEKKIVKFKLVRKPEFKDAEKEDIGVFLKHCKKEYAKVFLYGYVPISSGQQEKLETLAQLGLIYRFFKINRLSDLWYAIKEENVSVPNSFLVIKNTSDEEDAKILGFITHGSHNNTALWKKRKNSSEGGKSELEWNSRETLISLKNHIVHYLVAEDRLFLKPEYILYVENEYDNDINNYIQLYFDQINSVLQKKGMQLLYFPFARKSSDFNDAVLASMRYHLPWTYSLSDAQLNEVIDDLLNTILPHQFYRMILDQMGLPYFPRPALIRNIPGAVWGHINSFTYSHLSYYDPSKLNEAFDIYLNQVKIENLNEYVLSQKGRYQEEYNADLFFDRDSNALPEDLKKVIDELQAVGKNSILAEAVLYLMQRIKNEAPELISKIKPLIAERELLQAPVILSTLIIDEGFRLLLQDYGNQEVKLPPLPKALYLYFLKHQEGIRFAELFEYESELLAIYRHVSGREDDTAIRSSIHNLVDMRQPAINENCSRVRAAFRMIMDEPVAKYYYIDGRNGEPRKIALPKEMISIRCKLP